MRIPPLPLVFALLLPLIPLPLAAQETAAHYCDLGDASFAKKDYESARTNYTKATQLDPKYTPAYLKRAATNAADQQWDVVMADVSVAILNDPKNPAVFAARGNYRRILPDPEIDGAIADHKKAIELDPKTGEYHADLAADLAVKGDGDGAIAAYNDALALNPKDATSYTGLGILTDKKGDHNTAIADLTKAIMLNPDAAIAADAYAARAKALTAMGDKKDAAADMKKAKELGPKTDSDSED